VFKEIWLVSGGLKALGLAHIFLESKGNTFFFRIQLRRDTQTWKAKGFMHMSSDGSLNYFSDGMKEFVDTQMLAVVCCRLKSLTQGHIYNFPEKVG
jgi:hypothetical protein